MQLDLGNEPVSRLADMLREAERAHALYEQHLGHHDEAWADWYARHIYDRLTEVEEARSE
jgi:hypothetical protein